MKTRLVQASVECGCNVGRQVLKPPFVTMRQMGWCGMIVAGEYEWANVQGSRVVSYETDKEFR